MKLLLLVVLLSGCSISKPICLVNCGDKVESKQENCQNGSDSHR